MPTPPRSNKPIKHDLHRIASMFGMKAHQLFPKKHSQSPLVRRPHFHGGVYRINNSFGSNEPQPDWNPLTHTFLVTTWKDPDTGKEWVKDAYSWVSGSAAGEWEDPLKLQNIAGGQAAIDKGMAVRIGNEKDADILAIAYKTHKNDKGGFLTSLGDNTICKTAACSLFQKVKQGEYRRNIFHKVHTTIIRNQQLKKYSSSKNNIARGHAVQ